jgi:Skp family chaperone for outer membrane proteins
MKIYTDILRIVNEVAQQKGLDLVLEKNEPELLDSTPANELMLTIRTHKVLYSGGCVDITDEVIARLDAGK